MKTIIIIISLGILFSCTDSTEKEVQKESIPYGSSKQLEAIRKDIETKYASLSFEQKLDLCLLEFSFASPDVDQNHRDNPPKNMKATLLANEVFVKICKDRKVDPNAIPDDHFAAEKPAFMSMSELTRIINSK